MHDGGAAILGQGALDRFLVSNITFDAGQRLVANCPDAIQRHRTAVAEIIKNDDLLACIQQLYARMRADVSSAARHQDHSCVPLLSENLV